MVRIRTRSLKDSSTSTISRSSTSSSNKLHSTTNKFVLFSIKTLFWFIACSTCSLVAVTVILVHVRQQRQEQSTTTSIIIEKQQQPQQIQQQEHQQERQQQEHGNGSDTERQTTTGSTEHVINDTFTKIDNNNNNNVISSVRIKSVSASNVVQVHDVVKERKRSPHSREDILKILHGSSGTKKKVKKFVSTATIKKTIGAIPTKNVLTKATTSTSAASDIHPIIVSWIQPNNLTIWDECLVHELCKRKRIDPLGVPRIRPEPKPIWIPSHPGSGEELLRPKVIDIIVNQKQAGKTFYTKKCIPFKANTITASCSQVHPIIPIKPPPEERINKFYKNIIFQIRNPPYVLAAHYQEKANKYYKVSGQVIEKDWIQHRDASYQSSFLSWVKIIDTWKSYSPNYYNISLYVPFEKLYNQYTGPKLIEQLIHVFNDAGFDDLPILVNDNNGNSEVEEEEDLDSEIIEDEPNIIPDTILNQRQQQHRQRKKRRLQQTDSIDNEEEDEVDDEEEEEDQQEQEEEQISCTQCIWYKGIHKNRLVQYYGSKTDKSIQKLYEYEYSDYQPSFTSKQRDYYIKEIQKLINGKYSNDIQLISILQEYSTTIQNNLRIVD